MTPDELLKWCEDNRIRPAVDVHPTATARCRVCHETQPLAQGRIAKNAGFGGLDVYAVIYDADGAPVDPEVRRVDDQGDVWTPDTWEVVQGRFFERSDD